MKPVAGETWVSRRYGPTEYRTKVAILAVACHTSRFDGDAAETLVVFRVDRTQRDWAQPLASFMERFEKVAEVPSQL